MWMNVLQTTINNWFIRGRYDPFEDEEMALVLLEWITFDLFQVHDEDSSGVIPYQRDLTPSGSTVMTLKGSYPIHLHDKTTPYRPQRGRIFPLQIYHSFLIISKLQFPPFFTEFLYPHNLLHHFPFWQFIHEFIEITDLFCECIH